MLTTVLKDHGWNGARFHFSAEMKLDVKAFQKVLANLLLTKNQVAFTDDNSIIKSFCPDSLVRCLTDTSIVNKGSHMVSHHFYGTCMLVDISGFTKLSAALCTQGSSGLDQLHAVISGYLGECVRIVYAHGGDGK